MDFAVMLGDAWGYTREGIVTDKSRWLKLMLAVICLGIPFNGYILRVYRGANPAPEVDEWGTLFIDGLKMLAIAVVYIIPLIIIMIIIFGAMVLSSATGNMEDPGLLTGFLEFVFTLLYYVLQFIIAIFLPVAYIRFARTGVVGEAFNFSAMKETIGRIGWLSYIVAVVFVALIIGIPLCIILFALILGLIFTFALFSSNLPVLLGIIAVFVIILLIIIPVVGIFQARYLTRVYDSANQ